MNNDIYPKNTSIAVKLNQIINRKTPLTISERMSTRLVRCAASLPQELDFIGWQMKVPMKGTVDMAVFGSEGIRKSDLEWIVSETSKSQCANTSRKRGRSDELKELYELYLPVMEQSNRPAIGFGAMNKTPSEEDGVMVWPTHYSSQFEELVSVLRTSGAYFRAVFGKAGFKEQEDCRKQMLHIWTEREIGVKDYAGHPIKARFLLLLPEKPSVRLLTVLEEAVSGIAIRKLGRMEDPACKTVWADPLSGASVYPDYAARILLMEPEIHDIVAGIEQCDEPVRKIPASHKNTKTKDAIAIGRAEDTSGNQRVITIGDIDLRRHYQVVGMTGTGKSTLLANIILSAIKQGKGLTFFDPHGSTIDVVLRSVPEKYADRIRVVRIGDAENPVPLNIWDSDNPEKEERNIMDLCELFSDIFDPRKEGYVGPRYERWLSTFARASIAFLGRRASLESIAVISQNQDRMAELHNRIYKEYPEIAEIIKSEYGRDKSSDFTATLSWYLCKFQRLTGVEQLRKTLGGGTNALDFDHAIDTDTITLIDLAQPTIGAHAARIIGTLMLMKLWNAAMKRQEKNKTHLVVLDEASLWQTNPLPRMCAEGRKFGIALILSHQHAAQLTLEIREALEANSANFSAFRLSPRDALNASVRFSDDSILSSLTRLDAFNAVTTLSVDGRQTKPFTLEINRPKQQQNADKIAAYIEKRSRETLVEPYRHLAALTRTEILELLKHSEKEVPGKHDLTNMEKDHKEESPSWKASWNNMKSTDRRAG